MNNKEKFVFYSSPEHWLQTSLELNETIIELHKISEKSHFYENYHPDEKESIKRPFASRSIFLLMTYSLENLLKGIRILRDPDLVNKGKLSKELKTHELNRLTETTQIVIEEKEKIFQEYLSKLCVANARYPIGLNENQQLKHPSIKEDDFKSYFTLFKKYRQILVTEFNLKGWNSGLDSEELDTKPGEFTFVINPFYKPN